MARFRSLLLDMQIGRVIANVTGTASATATSVIAAPEIKRAGWPARSKKTTAKVVNNIGNGSGINFPNASVITKVLVQIAQSARGQDVIVRLKVGATYETATALGVAYTLTQNVSVKGTEVELAIAAGESVYCDITRVGSTRAGKGLSVYLEYYG